MPIPSTGSLIPLHSHNNINVLKELSQNASNQLLFHGKMIDASISAESGNLIKRKADGLYADGSIINDFDYKNGVLLFKGTTVSQEYDSRAVTAMIYELWKEYDKKQEESEADKA